MTGYDISPRSHRFLWASINKTGTCWLWTGARTADGYPRWTGSRNGKRSYAVHRWTYELLVGPIPDGLQLDHLCRVRHCVNPEHLEPVTARENTLRSNSPAALNALKTHCKHGHEFTPENTVLVPRGRRCHACYLVTKRRSDAKRRQRARTIN